MLLLYDNVNNEVKGNKNVTYKEARVYLDKVSKYGSVLGLDSIRNLLNKLDNPQDKLKFIHIAGTNGKGSTLSFISTILSEAGYRTGRYTSPAVISYLEMIQVDGVWISEEEFAELVEKVKNAIARMETKGQVSPTIFEVETAIAFLYFYKKECDYVVLETGLGGIDDATNIIKNTVASVISTISFDHIGILGHTIEEITEKKAGIIKPGSIVVSAKQNMNVRRILEKKAEEFECQIRFADSDQAIIEEESYLGIHFSYREWKDLQMCLTGDYQIENVTTALELMNTNVIPGITEDIIKKGLLKTQWPGRLQCINKAPVFMIDGAHNEDAAMKLARSVKKYFPDKKKTFICGVFKDKEYEKICKIMAPLADRIYTVDLPNKERTLCAEKLYSVMKKYCKTECDTEAVGEIATAVKKALDNSKKDEMILAFGSLSYLGEVIQCFNVRDIL